MKPSPPQSLKALQAFRAIAALLVLFFHANILCGDPRYYGFAPFPIFLAGAAGVPFFFVLSGFIIAHSHPFHRSGLREAKAFFLKRALRLYPLLWVVLAATLPFALAIGHQELKLGYLVCSFLSLPTGDAPPLAVQWTLQHEVLFYAVYALIIWIPKLLLPLLGALACTSLIGAAYFTPVFPAVFILDPSHVLFVVGVALLRITALPSKWRLQLIYGCGIFAFIATYAYAILSNDRLLPYYLVWSYGIASACIIWASTKLETIGALRVPAFLVSLGDASYMLYLIHFPLISLGLHVDHLLGSPSRIHAQLVYLVLVAGIIAISMLLHEYVERRMLAPAAKRIYRRLTASGS